MTSTGSENPVTRTFQSILWAVRLGLVFLSALGALPAPAALAPQVGTGSGAGGDAASSNATNYQQGSQLSINPRTGSVSMSAELIHIPGVVEDITLSLALSYRSDDARDNFESNTTYFGLPYGWWLNVSFIDNVSTEQKLYLDGSQVYVADSSWRTIFTPTGETGQASVKTGMLQYNRADANFREDNLSQPTVTVGGIPSAYVFARLDGTTRYFSAAGLLLQDTDRYGNSIRYFYDHDTNPRNARFTSITDSWGNEATFEYCDGSTCSAGEVIITLPDGRTVGWLAPDENTVTYIIDAEGKRTHLSWEASPCQHGNAVLSEMTSASGGMMAIEYSCLQVCTAPSSQSCQNDGNVTTWPVANRLFECPNNASGTKCPDGSSASDFLTTTYALSTTENSRNYTGYPLYSPYQTISEFADSLMESNDTGYQYTTLTSKLSAGQTLIYQTETDYNFLHLQTEQRIHVRARQSNGQFGLSLVKEKSYCYSVSTGGIACPLDAADYQNLPANYQSATIIGSCVYDVDDPGGRARRSVATMSYDSFGNVVNKREFHATGSQGIVSDCDRSTRLSTSGMRLVSDVYQQFDTPVSASSDGYVPLGVGSGHFGLLTAMQSFLYLDEDESGVGAHGALGATDEPVLVTLACHKLTSDSGVERAGTQLKENTTGLMANDAAPPTTPGVIPACDTNSWDANVAPPKTTSFSYDAQGRTLSKTSSWAAGFAAPGGVSSTGVTTTYTLTDSDPNEEGCGQGSGDVLEIAWTDVLGNTSKNRLCTLNGFQVAHIDATGNRTLFQHLPTGLVSRTTHPNGSANTTDYYYACPVAQDGRSHTCASSVPQGCPADDQQPARTCKIETMLAGSNPDTDEPNSSFADGVKQVTIKDGLGRVVAMRDNLGAGSDYTELQTRSTTTFNSLGLTSERVQQIGASEPLVYLSSVSYGPKLRPILTCSSHGDAHEFVHHDVDQQKLALFNGRERESYSLNDIQKPTTIANCALASGETGSGTGSCPTVASDADSTSCPADAYYTYVLHDGAGQQHSLAANAGATMDEGAAVSSVSGVMTYSADRLKYAYSYTGASDSQQVTATSTWDRDLNGQPLKESLTMQTDDGTTAASTDTYEFDELARKTAARNKLAASLVETDSYTPTGLIERNTNYEGVTFRHTYDSMDRLVRYCFASEDGGSEGERFVLDPITGSVLSLQHFTNDGSCDDCNEGECEGDVLGESIQYSYTRFGQLESMTYDDGVGAELQWAYDPYQRVTCFADAMATANGKSCPSSPTAVAFRPDPEDLLVSYRYWPDDDPYRRGRLQSTCRGVREPGGGYVTKCVDTDYYTPLDTGGACDSELSGAVGAYSGLVKQESYCTGGSCLDGSGTLVYRTTNLYDAHRRLCSVETRNAAGSLIRGSTFTHDQYDQVLSETHTSELDPAQDSNYQLLNAYDGMLRLVGQTRNDEHGNLIENVTYKYDAASNLVEKVQQIVQPPGSERTPTPDHPTPTAPANTPPPTLTPVTTPTPSAVPPDNDDGCQISPVGHRSCVFLIVAALVFALLSKRRIWERIGLLVAAVLASMWVPSGGAQILETITTSYQYNSDGALTAVTTQVDEEQPSTTYLTWDNFVPEAGDPTTGTISNNNGRLIAYGPNPGTDGAIAQFQYDRRDRLTGYAGNGHSVGYAHHPSGLMESTTLDGAEAWRFYYEDSDEPQVTNIYEDASALWSGYLDQARYLSNGSEEILLQPRKDVASVYLPQSQTVIPYRYDPYGSQDSSSDSGYDLSDNPFRYTRELRDPVWGGIYLRARWYQPDLPIFLSRDPMDGQVNHYGYAGGNPEMNVDPSGKSYKGFKRFVHKLDSGVGGHFSRLLLAPFLGPLEIAANPKGFWHQLKHDTGGVDLFLAAGILAEAVGPIGSLADPELFQAFSIETRFSVRLSTDVTLGVGQTVAAAASSGSGHFSWKTLAKGLESTAGSIGDVRLVGGVGYRPFDMSGDNVATMIARENLQEGEALIFRRQMRLPGTFRQGGPLQELLHLGVYHEQLIGVTKDGYFTSDFYIDDGVRNKFFELSPEARAVGATNEDYLRLSFKTKSGSFQFVGKTTSFDTTNGFSTVNTPGFAVEGTFAKPPAPTGRFAKFVEKFRISNDATGYNLFTNNCQYHAYAVRQYLGVR